MKRKSHNKQKIRFTVRLQSRRFYEDFIYAFVKEKCVTKPYGRLHKRPLVTVKRIILQSSSSFNEYSSYLY